MLTNWKLIILVDIAKITLNEVKILYALGDDFAVQIKIYSLNLPCLLQVSQASKYICWIIKLICNYKFKGIKNAQTRILAEDGIQTKKAMFCKPCDKMNNPLDIQVIIGSR